MELFIKRKVGCDLSGKTEFCALKIAFSNLILSEVSATLKISESMVKHNLDTLGITASLILMGAWARNCSFDWHPLLYSLITLELNGSFETEYLMHTIKVPNFGF